MPDLEIQRRENDIVIATFGRGFYVLDDYSPLRGLTAEQLEQDAILFPVKPALRYIESRLAPGSDGAQDWSADNPPFGAVFTYYLKDGLKSLEAQRQKAEKELKKNEKPVYYPPWDDLRAEEREEKPQILLTVRDAAGNVVRRINGSTGGGISRADWNLRWPGLSPVEGADATEESPWEKLDDGPMAVAGTYTVELHSRVQGAETLLAGPMEFEIVDLGLNPMAADQQAKLAFELQVQELTRQVEGETRRLRQSMERLQHLRVAAAAVAANEQLDRIGTLENELRDVMIVLDGDQTIEGRNEPVPTSVRSRVGRVRWSLASTTMGPTTTQRENIGAAEVEFAAVKPRIDRVAETDIPALVDALEAMGAPYSGGGEHLVPENDGGDEARRWKRF